MKATELKELSVADLQELLVENKSTLSKLMINHKIAELENPIQIKNYRRTIARIKTELTSRNLEVAK
jgi:large subunit ribosomal protein L29|tara:strand:+ start:199 stop:399 length:201 start_codon:yes stop_codon:yes gene_type:complete